MKTMGVRALKQNASAVVAEVAAGEAVTITDRGRPVAQMVPLSIGKLAALVARGQARPARRSFASLAAAARPARGQARLSYVLSEMRQDERY